MFRHFTRVLTAGIAVALALLGLTAVPATADPLTSCDGVWVVVQPESDDAASAVIGCAAAYGTGLAAATSAGFTVTAPGGFVSQIDGAPTDTNFGTNGGVWWAYYTATVQADGALGSWTISNVGANETTPAVGTAEGWILTNDPSFPPPGPGVTRVFDATASPSATGSPTATTTPTATASASTTATATPSPTATTVMPSASATASATPTATPMATAAAAGVSASARRAAGYLAKNPPTTDDGAGAFASAALAMAAGGQCTNAAAIRTLVTGLEAQTATYVSGNPGRAASLAITVSGLGLDPSAFGGTDLITAITEGTDTAGVVGSFPSAFSQALAIIAYDRASEPVPANVVTSLLTFQDDNGAFGYEFDGTFYTDPDSTALAITALSAVGGHATAIADAVAWALANQTSEGYWENYSPVDSTGLLGSAIELTGGDSGLARTWLTGKQLSNGGFANTLTGTSADLTATANALYLLAGTSMLTASLDLASCPTGAAGGSAGGADDPSDELAATGNSPLLLPFGLAGLGLVAVGGLLVMARGSRRTSGHSAGVQK